MPVNGNHGTASQVSVMVSNICRKTREAPERAGLVDCERARTRKWKSGTLNRVSVIVACDCERAKTRKWKSGTPNQASVMVPHVS